MEQELKEIRETEKKARKMIEDSESRRSEIINKARQDSMQVIRDAQESIDLKNQGAVKSKTAEISGRKQRIISKGREDAQEIGRKAEKNLKKAEDLILKKLEEKILR